MNNLSVVLSLFSVYLFAMIFHREPLRNFTEKAQREVSRINSLIPRWNFESLFNAEVHQAYERKSQIKIKQSINN